MTRIDLNADVGEHADPAADDALLALVSRANVACGAHAGDEAAMRHVLARCRALGVAAGAHPGHADQAHRGRRPLPLGPPAAAALVRGQIADLAAIAAAARTRLVHVKPHGALYHQLEGDAALAEAVVAAIGALDPSLLVVGLAGGRLVAAARARGLPALDEAFADRAYRADGSLVPRGDPGALLPVAAAAAQAVALARDGMVQAVDGTWLTVRADTLCLHGDGPAPVATAQAVRAALAEAGIAVTAA